jgi:predicted enzyme related to lactoylglutathione lyase
MNSSPAVMFEFIASDQKRLCEFYRQVFGWQYQVEGGFAYVKFAPQLITPLGGIGQAKPDEPGWQPGRNFYLATHDVKASLAKVVEAGGKVAVPVTETDGYTFAMFTDPEGNLVGLLQTKNAPDNR